MSDWPWFFYSHKQSTFFTDKEKLDVGNPGDESERVHTTRFLTIVQFPIPSCR